MTKLPFLLLHLFHSPIQRGRNNVSHWICAGHEHLSEGNPSCPVALPADIGEVGKGPCHEGCSTANKCRNWGEQIILNPCLISATEGNAHFIAVEVVLSNPNYSTNYSYKSITLEIPVFCKADPDNSTEGQPRHRYEQGWLPAIAVRPWANE